MASWTQIGDARRGATVIQSLPFGNIGDMSGAQSATLERVWNFEGWGDETDIVQIGKAYITANHPILTVDGWMLASQAADKGHGKLPSDREYSQLCSLQLATGGNILINTSTSPELPSVYTEAATMGCRFSPPSNSLNRNFPIYASQGTGPRDGSAAQSKPSYSQVIAFNSKRLSKRPILPPTPLTPETHALPKFIAKIEKTVKGHKGEPTTGISATAHLGTKTEQRTSEEYCGDLDAAMTGTNRIRPTGTQKSCREVIQEDGPGGVDEGHETGLRVQDNRDGSTGSATEVQSHRDITDTTCPAIPPATCPNIHSPSGTEPGLKGKGTPSFSPGTLLLILNAGQAAWIPIWKVKCGATVIQSLPSGSTGDVSGAQLATIEKVRTFRLVGGVIDIVQLGKAHITIHHPILTVDGWMTASQAAAKGHGQVLPGRMYLILYSLQLVTDGKNHHKYLYNLRPAPDTHRGSD